MTHLRDSHVVFAVLSDDRHALIVEELLHLGCRGVRRARQERLIKVHVLLRVLLCGVKSGDVLTRCDLEWQLGDVVVRRRAIRFAVVSEFQARIMNQLLSAISHFICTFVYASVQLGVSWRFFALFACRHVL